MPHYRELQWRPFCGIVGADQCMPTTLATRPSCHPGHLAVLPVAWGACYTVRWGAEVTAKPYSRHSCHTSATTAPNTCRGALEALKAQTFRDFEVILVDNASTDGSADRLQEEAPASAPARRASSDEHGLRRSQQPWCSHGRRRVAGPAQSRRLSRARLAGATDAGGLGISRRFLCIPADPGEPSEHCWMATETSISRAGLPNVATTMFRITLPALPGRCSALVQPLHFIPVSNSWRPVASTRTTLRTRRTSISASACACAACAAIWCRSAIVYHVGAGSTGPRSHFATYHGHRNLVWTYVKDMPVPWFWLYLPLHLAWSLISIIYLALRGQGLVILHAKLDAVRGLGSALRKRRAVQAERRIDFHDVLSAMNTNPFGPLEGIIDRTWPDGG